MTCQVWLQSSATTLAALALKMACFVCWHRAPRIRVIQRSSCTSNPARAATALRLSAFGLPGGETPPNVRCRLGPLARAGPGPVRVPRRLPVPVPGGPVLPVVVVWGRGIAGPRVPNLPKTRAWFPPQSWPRLAVGAAVPDAESHSSCRSATTGPGSSSPARGIRRVGVRFLRSPPACDHIPPPPSTGRGRGRPQWKLRNLQRNAAQQGRWPPGPGGRRPAARTPEGAAILVRIPDPEHRAVHTVAVRKLSSEYYPNADCTGSWKPQTKKYLGLKPLSQKNVRQTAAYS